MKRANDQQQVAENSGNKEKRSRLGYKPENVKQAEEDQSAVVHTEVRAIIKFEYNSYTRSIQTKLLISCQDFQSQL